jgi:histidinol dehydrogenase
MRIVRGAQEAAKTLLRRGPSDEPTLPPAVRAAIRRVFGEDLSVAAVAGRILSDVRREGDAAVRRYNEAIDGVTASGLPLEVAESEIEAAWREVDSDLLAALRLAADRVRRFHEWQLEHSVRSFQREGLGQVVRPLRRAGLYVPGTEVVYPSTVLMMAVPARVAGVAEVVMATPARKDGSVSPLKLAAAKIAGVDRVFRAGGVQGIAALAYGTESVPRVDKICGPGNIFVTVAKKLLFGETGIDGIFGPSETLVVADSSADPRLVAADLLAGAEHDELATAVLLTDSEALAEAVTRTVEEGLPRMARRDVARASLEARGGAAIVGSVAEAIELASEFAPEHLCLHLADAAAWAQRVRNAGCIFIGECSVESVGDYTAGPSHVMPTGGSAAFASPLGVHDFLKVTTVAHLDRAVLDAIGPASVAIARAEGLTGHADAVQSRLKGDGA